MLLPTRCPVCEVTGPAPCARCRAELAPAPLLPLPPGLDRVTAAFAYDGAARELVARLKYRNGRAAVAFIASALAETVDGARVDVVTWAPTTDERRRVRGYDHAELLARAVARRLRLPARGLLRRAPGRPQTGRRAHERRADPPSFVAPRRPPTRVLLVDDVTTTGTTLTAGARALRAAGATSVVAVVAARTPPGRHG